jgi:HSP90 family molecular chaperone
MRTLIFRFGYAALLSAALVSSAAVAQEVEVKTYHDRARNDDHRWDSHEDQAYRIWVNENHRQYKEFSTIRENDRQRYWAWRHHHSDALLKIEVR